MNKGVEILLSRMQSCPEEFTNVGFNGGGVSRWTEIMSAVTSRINKTHPIIPLLFLTDEEVKLLYIGYMQLQGDAFTRSVVDTLIKNEEGAKIRTSYPNKGKE